MRKFLFILSLIIVGLADNSLFAQQDSTVKKKTNLISIAIQPSWFRLGYDNPNFFNNPEFKFGGDVSILYGKAFCKSWVDRIGVDFVFNQGTFLITNNKLQPPVKDKKYINETFLRIPEILIKKIPIECSTCILDPVVFIEVGGYVSFSMQQSTYIEDAPTGLSSLDKKVYWGYAKSGLMAGLGLSYLSNNFGRHIIGVRVYNDQWFLKDYSTSDNPVDFKPTYTSFSVYYNIANFGW